jgi:hypothetical protein
MAGSLAMTKQGYNTVSCGKGEGVEKDKGISLTSRHQLLYAFMYENNPQH